MEAGSKKPLRKGFGGPQPGSGRPKGARSKSKLEAEAAARAIVDDPEYRKRLKARAQADSLPPAVETMLWHYAHGKPVERVEHSGVVGIAEIVASRPKSGDSSG